MFLPPGTTSKMLSVNIATKKVKIGIKGQTPIVEGEFPEKIKPDETLWTVEDDKENGRVL